MMKTIYNYVVDNDSVLTIPLQNDHILKFDSKGELLAIVGSRGEGDLQFNKPVGICFNKTNQLLYVCDQLNHRIQVLTKDLKFTRSFGEHGQENGQFDRPLNLAFDSNNHLYITDSINHRVQVFTADGKFVTVFSDKANRKSLCEPNAIAIDSSNTVYVSELKRPSVSMFTSQGKYFASFGEFGNEDWQFNSISSLCVDNNDCVLVSDNSSRKLQIF